MADEDTRRDDLPDDGQVAADAPDHPADGPEPFDEPTPEQAQSYEGQAAGAVPPEDEGAPAQPEDAAAATRPDGDADEDEVDPVAVVEAERDAYLDQLQRARADYDNLNKRRHKEVAEARDRGQAALVEGLLEVLDNFGFALRAAEESEDTHLAKGVRLVYDQLLDVLTKAGLEEVPGVGAPFDPAHHEALMSTPDDEEREHPEVVEVLRTGYRFKAHLLRPASVRVAD